MSGGWVSPGVDDALSNEARCRRAYYAAAACKPMMPRMMLHEQDKYTFVPGKVLRSYGRSLIVSPHIPWPSAAALHVRP